MSPIRARAADACALILTAGIALAGIELASRSIARASIVLSAVSTDTLPVVGAVGALALLAIEQTVPVSAWRAGVNQLVLRFSRATRPRDVGVSGNDRLLSAAVDVRVAEVR